MTLILMDAEVLGRYIRAVGTISAMADVPEEILYAYNEAAALLEAHIESAVRDVPVDPSCSRCRGPLQRLGWCPICLTHDVRAA